LTLFESGAKWIEEKTGKSVFGVLPWYNHINIEAEDSVVIEKPIVKNVLFDDKRPSIAIIRLPHISNFTDFEPLFEISEINTCYVLEPKDLFMFNCVIIPGSKSTISDLKWIKKTGWAEKIQDYSKQSTSYILGICGGYQMMGEYIYDPDGLEGPPVSISGLSLLPVETTLKSPKITARTVFSLDDVFGLGYEIHMGQTKNFSSKSMFTIKERNGEVCNISEGCVVENNRFMGTYIHGLFDSEKIITKWLVSINIKNIEIKRSFGLEARDAEYDLLAEHFEKYIDIKKIYELTGL
jgi:adenosylcobyric acid synthase